MRFLGLRLLQAAIWGIFGAGGWGLAIAVWPAIAFHPYALSGLFIMGGLMFLIGFLWPEGESNPGADMTIG